MSIDFATAAREHLIGKTITSVKIEGDCATIITSDGAAFASYAFGRDMDVSYDVLDGDTTVAEHTAPGPGLPGYILVVE